MHTLNSRIKDICKSPVGHDILKKLLLQMGVKDWVLLNPIVGNLRLKTIARLIEKALGEGFLTTFLNLVNSEKSAAIVAESHDSAPKWWKEAVFYQIYPRSFKDSNGDGVGDIDGIASKLDYLKALGVDAIWLCPIYDSPNDDNGYDIRDYRKISDEFGGMEAFDRLLDGIRKRGMKLVMDLVVNHTSDEHEWFRKALQDEGSPYRDYYFFRDGADGGPPNNWTSFFSGSAWKKQDDGKWTMHLFSSKQMDLNWEHEPMRRQIHEMIRWWLEKGVDGFRLDVINYISKAPGLPQGNPQIGNIMGYTGIEHYFYGPKLHAHLAEMRREAFDPFNAFSVGETPGIGLEMTKLLTSSKRKELDMAFCFDILETPGKARFDEYAYDPAYIKEYYTYWMEGLGSDCWMALFFNNHDNPRMVSKIDPESKSRKEVAKLLAMIQLTLRGTPFIYQGDELGAGNQMFKAIEDMRDVESLNLYQELLAKMDPEAAFKKVLSGTRDHARVPMQWEKDGGFTTGEPWIKGCLDGMDAASQLEDESSVLAFYRKLIELRRNNKALVYGDVAIAKGCGRKVFAYHRKLKSECFFICCNMSSREAAKPKIDGKLILSNWPDESGRLRPYEASLYKSV